MEKTRCCIVGCGPAGAMLGLLLARAGVEVIVLEKHSDFLRDFRGDTIHPATLEILDQIGLADRFLDLPHSKVADVGAITPAGQTIRFTLRRLKTRFPYIAFVPQWDFLDFITAEAARYPTFRLIRDAEATGLLWDGDTVIGVRYQGTDGPHAIRALLTVGTDGRGSITRQAAKLPLVETSPPMDVLWFRLPKRSGEPETVAFHVGPGVAAITIDRRTYWQIAYIIPKGGFDRVQAAGLDAFRAGIAALIPVLADRAGEITDWDQVKLLTVRSDRLARWHVPGYLAIGDAAHAMTPVGGVGINLAIQDAVTAANVLWRPLRRGRVPEQVLAQVQNAREWPTRLVQAAQSVIQRRFLRTVPHLHRPDRRPARHPRHPTHPSAARPPRPARRVWGWAATGHESGVEPTSGDCGIHPNDRASAVANAVVTSCSHPSNASMIANPFTSNGGLPKTAVKSFPRMPRNSRLISTAWTFGFIETIRLLNSTAEMIVEKTTSHWGSFNGSGDTRSSKG